MRQFSDTLNDLLVDVFHNILRVEEEHLQKGYGNGLSIREMHMIEYIGKGGQAGRTLSEIADFLKVARPSVTVSAKKLESKGYLVKNNCAEDGRVIKVTLTRDGRRVYMHHMRFHALMVRELEASLSDDEKSSLTNAIEKLDKYFEKSIEAVK